LKIILRLTKNLKPGTWNLELGTWNFEPGTLNLIELMAEA
jgi:hypothetical protein